MMTVQFVELAGQKMALLPEDEYRRLVEAAEETADIRTAMIAEARAAEGEEYVPEVVIARLVEGEPPLLVWRTYRGLSHEQLGRKAGLSGDLLAQVEMGRQDLGPVQWSRVADALGVDLEDLGPPA